MGSILFECECGHGQFLTSIDNRSYVAHLIPDQHYDQFSGLIDDAIEHSLPQDKDAACMAWRAFRMPRIWQCYACGSIYVESEKGERHRFLPESEDVPKDILKRR